MPRIVVFKEKSPNDVLRVFADQMADAFRFLGQEVFVVDLTAGDAGTQLQRAFESPCHFVVSFNAGGYNLSVDDKSIYDILGTTFVAYMLDDPVYHIEERLSHDIDNYFITCSDKSHLSFVNAFFDGEKNCAFLPPSGCSAPSGRPMSFMDRKIPILLCGDYQEPEFFREQWHRLNTGLSGLFDDIAEEALSRTYASVPEVMEDVLTQKGIILEKRLLRSVSCLLKLVDYYLRYYRWRQCLQVLAASGLAVDFYGSPSAAQHFSGKLKFNGPANFLDMLSLMQQARIVINVNSAFPDGGSESVFSAMLNGAVCVSDKGRFLNEEFVDGEEIIFYDWNNIDRLPELINVMLDNPHKMADIALSGQGKVREKHTLVARAQKLIDMVNHLRDSKALYSAKANKGTWYNKMGQQPAKQKEKRMEPASIHNDLLEYCANNQGRLIFKWSHYFEIYDRHFSKYRNTPVNVLEIGIFRGGSLQMWKHYFGDNANIFGLDIDPQCKLLEEDRIKIFIGDQKDREFLRSLKRELPKIDILIDDGGHEMIQQITTFEELFPSISEDGVYLCEDLHTSYWANYGGGYKNSNSFIEYSKNLIDYLNAWHSRETELFNINDFTKSAYSMHYYDSVLVIEKRNMTPPHMCQAGR